MEEAGLVYVVQVYILRGEAGIGTREGIKGAVALLVHQAKDGAGGDAGLNGYVAGIPPPRPPGGGLPRPASLSRPEEAAQVHGPQAYHCRLHPSAPALARSSRR